ncbi:antiviral innate immune response receptor RIG-I-like isoform X1 [Dreissena polymorpha]|uniref:antiviral innate immune response receptor RIG-I-like isoform X1 n=1 Tax=Dreissena polymorpha TaxID=45954 RepID=UPI002264D3D6|nr:antiviral innate immune response receptor RIG-I-like isoform X1 [Dreissena polymorpha]
MASYEHLDEATLEFRMTMWRSDIENCFKNSDIVTKFGQYGLLQQEDVSRLLDMYEQKSSLYAAKIMLQIIYTKNQQRKWHTFVSAIEDAGYEFVVSRLVADEVEIAEERERGKHLLLFFGPHLENKVDPIELIASLLQRQVIKQEDADRITNVTHNKSKAEGIRVLLQRIQMYMKPHKWWNAFINSLCETGYEDIARLLEPDYLCCKALGEEYETDDALELNMEEKMEVEPSSDLNCQPSTSEQTNSMNSMNDLTAKQAEHVPITSINCNADRTEFNLKELNIKPDNGKTFDRDENLADDYDEMNERNSDFGGSDVEEDVDDNLKRNRDLNDPIQRTYKLEDYQEELAEKAVRGHNTIICAETGTGKTWVALHIIDKHLSKAVPGSRKAVFMANQAVLIKQQSNRLKKVLPQYRTKLITGEGDESRILDAFIPDNDILCFTPQILLNSLESGNISSLSKFSLLVFDECHHTKGDAPYARLARRYLQEKSKSNVKLPQIVGLTASIGVGRARSKEEAVEHILRICACLDVTPPLSTVVKNRNNYEKFVNTPKEETIKMVVKNPDPCKHVLLKAMEKTEEIMQEMIMFQSSLVDLFEEKRPNERESQAYNNWTVDMMNAAQQRVGDAEIARDISASAMYLNVYNSALEVNNLLRVLDVVKYLASKHEGEFKGKHKHTETEKRLFDSLRAVQTQLLKLNTDKEAHNPNVHTISKQLQDMLKEKGDDSRAIVFVKARATCRALAAFLDADLQDFGLRARPLFGKQTKGAEEGMTESVQTETVEKFRDGHYKVMVCTSVGTEGIDVPDCNIVINYNYSGDEITKIQMKGRSRKKGATHVMVGDDKLLEQEMVNAYKVDLMRKAMVEIQNLNASNIQYKIRMFQENEKKKFLLKDECSKAKKSCSEEDDLEVRCKHCNEFGCFVSDLRKLDCHYFVVDADFRSKVTRKPDTPRKFDGIEIKVIMDCPKCTKMWGHVGQREQTELYLLKLAQFKFVRTANRETFIYRKWTDVPFHIPELKPGDISKLYGN